MTHVEQLAKEYSDKLYSEGTWKDFWQFIKNLWKAGTPAARDFAAGYRAAEEDDRAFRETAAEIESGLRSQIIELTELVKDVAKTQTTDEAWEQSERCYDWLDIRGHSTC